MWAAGMRAAGMEEQTNASPKPSTCYPNLNTIHVTDNTYRDSRHVLHSCTQPCTLSCITLHLCTLHPTTSAIACGGGCLQHPPPCRAQEGDKPSCSIAYPEGPQSQVADLGGHPSNFRLGFRVWGLGSWGFG